MVEPTSTIWPREHPCRSPPASSSMTGRDASAISADSGTISTTIQVSSADPIRRTSSRSPRSAGPASTGTTMLASAPPATISYTMLGNCVEVKYAWLRQDVVTVCENA